MRFERKWTQCTVHAIRDVAPAIREFVLRPDQSGVEGFAPGSHVNVGVSIDGRLETRCYSLVGDPSPDGYRIAVRRAPDSRGGSRYMWSLKQGARIEVSSPASLFEIDWSRKSWCLIAGGIGITPIVGIASALMRRHADVELHYAVRSRREAADLAQLSGLPGERLVVHASDEGPRHELEATSGRLPPGRWRRSVARCACSTRRGAAGRRPRLPADLRMRPSARAGCCRPNRAGSGSTSRAGRSWSPKTGRCWMRSTTPASR